MAILIIKNENVELEIPDGDLIIEYLWNNTSFPQGCADGSTSLCSCVILNGEKNLNPKTQAEINTFAKASLPNSPRNRLACQVRILKGTVELEY